MRKVKFSELINASYLEEMAENIYAALGIPIGIVDIEEKINIAVGWTDICNKFHRNFPATYKRCLISDRYINEHIKDGGYISYKCLNNMWDIALPIIISGEHMATIFFGQFFYEDEVIDTEYFRAQAIEFGFDEKEYLAALGRVPIYSKEKVEHLLNYYAGVVMSLAESGLRQLELIDSQSELEKSQKYLNTIFNSVSDSIFIHDIYGNIMDTNDTATIMFGYSREELKIMKVWDLVLKNYDNTKFDIEVLVSKARENDPFIVEYLVKSKNNREFWVEGNIHITKILEEEIIVATVRDITERKQIAEAKQNETQELEKLRTEFFANISHELRTPLNIILGTIQITGLYMRNEEMPINREKIMNNVNVEKQNCFRLLRLINNLIDSTKFDSGMVELNMENCDIVNVVEEITLSVAAYTDSNQLSLVFDTDIEEKIVACDLDKMERIMLNILSNSIKFTSPGGSIFVNILDGDEHMTISIEDTGIGIPEDKLNIIFDRFRQVDKSFTRDHEGSGIGLSLVKSLVEMQGATIFVESKYGIGTKFSICFPVKQLDYNELEASTKLADNTINDNVQRINIEFSDIYN